MAEVIGYQINFRLPTFDFHNWNLNLIKLIWKVSQLDLIKNYKKHCYFRRNLTWKIIIFFQSNFSTEVNYLLSLGIDHTIRLWDLSDYNSIRLKVKFAKPIQTLAFQFLNSEKNQDFKHIWQYSEIDVIEDQNQFDFKAAKQQLNIPKYIDEIKGRTQDILDSQTKFNSNIYTILFTPSQQQFMLGMGDGSILFYKIEQQTLKIYEKPICYHIFAKNPLLSALNCSIRGSTFQTIENENFEIVLCEKGGKK
ncbi:unnamed protein product [Paramecium pentaurelia]|uniref:Uncharacterized protein n=1 Tax=Paramecium pentaurelia TaxID=43138 RepID=A0A8S1T4N5_9CILI|nr:unnamed protein product [Paramecium pentaurelia]